jgi:CHASE1-domain containing sensor protein
MCLLQILYFFVLAAAQDGDTPSEVHLTKWVASFMIIQILLYTVFATGIIIHFAFNLLKQQKRRKLKNQIMPYQPAI